MRRDEKRAVVERLVEQIKESSALIVNRVVSIVPSSSGDRWGSVGWLARYAQIARSSPSKQRP